MKTIITMIAMFLTMATTAQTEDDNVYFFVKKTLDWKMLAEGPGHSYEANSSYNPETMLGFEFPKSRVGTGFESHKEIKYSKWFLEYAEKYSAILSINRIGDVEILFFVGVEFGVIWRTYEYELPSFQGVLVDDTEASMTGGLNFEMQIKIVDGLYFSSNLNTFTTEGGSSEKVEFLRWDVMAGLNFKIPYNL